MKCLKPIQINGMTLNCGHCHACRVNITSQWTLRLLYELDSWDSASFLTLTYDDEHLPSDYGLHKKDLQNFNKRLRQLAYRRLGLRLKMYSIGEYGSVTKRPHYHGIYFGLSPYEAEHRQLVKDAWRLCPEWQFNDRGNKTSFGEVTHDSIQYVTGYVQKKLSGDLALEEYRGRQKPFSLVSRGLGLTFANNNAERLIRNGYTYLRGQKIGLPRYFRDKLGIEIKTQIQKSKVEQFKDEMEYLIQEFYKQNPAYSNLDFSNLDNLPKAFERWYDQRRWDTASIIEKNFLQRSKHG